MRRKALGKHGWSISGGLLLYLAIGGPAHAAQNSVAAQLAIGNPVPNSLIGGRITMSVGYNQGVGHISAFTVYVDDKIQYSRNFSGTLKNGIQYLDLDTRSLPDGNHTVKVVANGLRGVLAEDQVDITVRNGVVGGVDLVPPLVQFKGLTEGQEVSGKITLDVLAEDNATMDLLVSIFVNRQPRLLKNRPPYSVELDTAQYLDPNTHTGSIMVEAWAYDKANNLGKAKPITLKVVPVDGREMATNKQDDPTKPTSVPMPSGMNEPSPMPVGPSKVIDVPLGSGGAPRSTDPGSGSKPVTSPMGSGNYGPVGPAPDLAPTSGGSHVVAERTAQPGDRPSTHAVPAKLHGAAPSLARGSAVGGSLGSTRGQLPSQRGPSARSVASNRHNLAAPDAIATHPGGSPAKAGQRSTQPLRMAANPLIQPSAEIRQSEPPTLRATGEPVGSPSTSARASMPTVEATGPVSRAVPAQPTDGSDRPGDFASEPMGASGPMGAPRATLPSQPKSPSHPSAVVEKPHSSQPVRMAKGGPVIVMPRPGAKPDSKGNVPLEVYRLAQSMQKSGVSDRTYRVHPGDTVLSIARKFKVTPKCLQVANGLQVARSLRAGSIVKVPGTYDVVMNDQQVAFDVSPRLENGIPLTPFRQIMEHAGGVVVWYPETQDVRAANDQKEVKLHIGSKEAKVNEVVFVMDRAAFLDSGRTIVPMSFMEKALDLKAEYDVKTKTVMLVRK